VHKVDSAKQLQTPDTKEALTIVDDMDRFKYTHSIIFGAKCGREMQTKCSTHLRGICNPISLGDTLGPHLKGEMNMKRFTMTVLAGMLGLAVNLFSFVSDQKSQGNPGGSGQYGSYAGQSLPSGAVISAFSSQISTQYKRLNDGNGKHPPAR
jgi:hypothetical protein